MIDHATQWGPLTLGTLAALCVIGYWWRQTTRHMRLLRGIPIRVHVNGIRGKSTVVRYIAGALREAGIETVAKTTGSATRIIHPDGSEEPIQRSGAPTIIEQIEILRRATGPATRAIVIECMALNTEYQRVSEQRMIRSTDGIIINVRRDHVQQLGYDLPDIARSLSNTAPRNAPLLTAEERPDLQDILRTAAERNGGELVTVSAKDVSEDELEGFSPLTFPQNIALALAVALRHGVDREIALRGMRKARMDPGASKVFVHSVDGRDLYWVDLFGVNDVESAQDNLGRVRAWAKDRGDIVLLLNNRADRESRTVEFAGMVARSRKTDHVMLMGENLDALQNAVREAGLEGAEVLGVPSGASARQIAEKLPGSGNAVLVGLANIHTDDANRIRAALENDENLWTGDSDAATRAAA